MCNLDRYSHSCQVYSLSIEPMNNRVSARSSALVEKKNTMTHGTHKPTPKLRKALQPPLSHAGAVSDSDRAKRSPLSEASAIGSELSPGDRVEGLGNLGSRMENSAQSNELTKKTRSSSGMMTVERESTNRRSRRFSIQPLFKVAGP